MKTEREKMVSGELYDPRDPGLAAERRLARLLLTRINATRDDQLDERLRLIHELIPVCGSDVEIEPPFYCDYGSNIRLGDKVFLNFNCVVLDVAPVVIGARTLIGPDVQICAATHPMSATQRRTGLELGRPIEIGSDAWLGAGVIVCPGVKIGDEAVIGAGSVVTQDVPARVLAVGNPCRVIRELEP